jgi:hypothetical protein
MFPRLPFGRLVLSLLGLGGGASAQTLQATLLSHDGAPQDAFGNAVALSGERALVGAELDNHSARSDAGSAYVFERDGAGVWSEVAKLTAADRAAGDHFGTAVSLGPERALIGADGDDDQGSFSGSAYVFERDTNGAWSERAKLLPADGAAFDIFGDALALSGARALVGAPGNASGTGAAYVFERTSGGAWVQVAKLTARDAAPGAFFGNAVALAGGRALVGAFSDDRAASDAGAVYVFELDPAPFGAVLSALTPHGLVRRPEWRQVAKLEAHDVAPGAAFGGALALAGTRALIGAYGDDERGADAGAAYVFACVGGGAWVEETKLLAPGAAAGDLFGAVVALSGSRALVAAVRDDDLGTDAGSAHLFVNGSAGWAWSAELHASGGGSGFGEALALRGNRALAGAPRADGAALASGAAYVLELP